MTNVIVAFVNVGQGDCIVGVDRNSGHALLVDCPAGRHEDALATLEAYDATRLELAVVTHQHLDHLGGVYSTVTSFPTDCVRMNAITEIPADPDEKKKLRAAFRAICGLPRLNIATAGAYAGDAGQVGELCWRVLAPDHSQLLFAQSVSRSNHASIVVKLAIGAHNILLSSDADMESWSAIMARGTDVCADVYQLPHHGASMEATSAGLDFGQVLDAVEASYYLISVGSGNNYGHPAKSTLGEIRNRRGQVRTLCTQLNAVCAGTAQGANVSCAGTVTITFLNGTMTVSPSVADHGDAVSALPAAQCI